MKSKNPDERPLKILKPKRNLKSVLLKTEFTKEPEIIKSRSKGGI
jgi:hypothetical protein